MFRYALIVIGLASWLGATEAAAQFVRVGPLGGVSIRGPRGSIDVLPFGLGTRIQSPASSLSTGLFGLTAPPRYPYGYSVPPAPSVVYRPQVRYELVPVYPVIAVPVIVEPVYVQPVFVDPSPAPITYFDSTTASAPAMDQRGYDPAVENSVVVNSYFGATDMVLESPITTSSYESMEPFSEPASIQDKLRAAAVRLRDSLSMRHLDADIWLNYLSPDRIIVALDSDQPADDLSDLLRNYDGMAGNSDLSHIWSLDGFWQTHQALRDWVEMKAASRDPATENSDDRDDETPTAKVTNEPTLMPSPEEVPEGEVEELPAPTGQL